MLKGTIVEALGESELLLPDRVTRGLVANDRVKYFLSLLQAAAYHATHVDQPVSSLRAERDACGVGDASLDSVVEASRLAAGGDLYVPAGRQIVRDLFEELDVMLAPLRSTGGLPPDRRPAVAVYERRLERLRLQGPAAAGDLMTAAAIDALTTASGGADTVHQLTMDLHKELNRLQALVADEVIDGARTYGLAAADRPLVGAFMKGVNESAPLKFDHPGLGTTATRAGTRLSIQNDIGTTDAHVVVLHVEGLAATLIYTDVHRRRSLFLRELLAPFAVEWQDKDAPRGVDWEMEVGRYVAKDVADLERYLAFLGSRLVFLIDWNRARKALGAFVKKRDAAGVLKWAADNGVGHCAFLSVDGPGLVQEAIDAAAPGTPSSRLDSLLGAETAGEFLEEVLKITADGLRAGRSAGLLQDQIEAALRRRMRVEARDDAMEAAAEHAMYVSALAERLRREFTPASRRRDGGATRSAELASAWAGRADALVRRKRRVVDRPGAVHLFPGLLDTADLAADALDEAAFLLTLVPGDSAGARLAPLDRLPELVAAAVKEYVRCLELAKLAAGDRSPADVDAFLVAVDRLASLERDCHGEARAAERRLLSAASAFGDLHVLSRLVDAFARAAHALARCGGLIKDRVLAGGAS